MKIVSNHINRYLIRPVIKVLTFVTISLLIAVGISALICERVYAYDEIIVVIDPGHGGEVVEGEESSNAGAMYHDLYEKDVNLITAKALRDELETYENVTVYMTRDDDIEMSLEERVNFAVEHKADVLISVHYNASEDHNFFGSEIFVSAFGECYSTGYDIANSIMDEWIDYGNVKKDIKTRIGNSGKDYYGLLRSATSQDLPAIILEHGYLDNDEDYLRLKSESAWKEMGLLDAEGIANYYGLSKNLVKDNIEPNTRTKIPSDPVMPDETAPEDVTFTIDEYDSDTGKLQFTIKAKDAESKLMYYGFVLEEADENTVFPELFLWEDNKSEISGVFEVKKNYEGPITATVFNVYQLNTNSDTQKLTVTKQSKNENEDEEADEEDGPLKIYNHKSDESIKLEEGNSIASDEDVDLDEVAESEEENEDDAEEGKVTIYGEMDFTKNIDDQYAKAVGDNVNSNVEDSYKKLMTFGLIAGILVAVTLVLVISSAVKKSKKKKKYEEFRNNERY